MERARARARAPPCHSGTIEIESALTKNGESKILCLRLVVL